LLASLPLQDLLQWAHKKKANPPQAGLPYNKKCYDTRKDQEISSFVRQVVAELVGQTASLVKQDSATTSFRRNLF
jgi:hypothetical protein